MLRLAEDRLVHLLLGHLDLSLTADLSEQQAEAHPALGERIVLVRRLDFRVVVALNLRVLLVPQLMRDLLRLSFNEALRQIERHGGVQLVQQLSLQDLARGVAEFGGKTLLHLLFQGVEIVEAVFLGEFIVDLRRDRLGHFLDGAGKDRGLPGQRLDAVGLGESHLDLFLFTGLGADELFFEARNELAGAEHKRVILRRAAFKLFAVHAADKVEGDLIAVLGLGTLAARLEGLGLLGELLHRLLDVLVGGFDHHFLKADLGKVGVRNFRKTLILHFDVEVVALIEVLVGDGDFRLLRRHVAGLVEMSAHCAVDRLLHHFAKKVLAEHLLQQRLRGFALAKALHLEIGAHGVDLLIHL